MNLKIHFSGGAPLGVPHLSRMTIFLSLHHSVTGHLYKSPQPRCPTGPSNLNATKNWTPNLLHSLPVLLENAMLAISGLLTVTYAVCQRLRMIVLSKCIVWSGLHANFIGTVFVQASYVVLACIGQRASVVFLPVLLPCSHLSKRQAEPAFQRPISNEHVFDTSQGFIYIKSWSYSSTNNCLSTTSTNESIEDQNDEVVVCPRSQNFKVAKLCFDLDDSHTD